MGHHRESELEPARYCCLYGERELVMVMDETVITSFGASCYLARRSLTQENPLVEQTRPPVSLKFGCEAELSLL